MSIKFGYSSEKTNSFRPTPWHWSELPFPAFRGKGARHIGFLAVARGYVPSFLNEPSADGYRCATLGFDTTPTMLITTREIPAALSISSFAGNGHDPRQVVRTGCLVGLRRCALRLRRHLLDRRGNRTGRDQASDNRMTHLGKKGTTTERQLGLFSFPKIKTSRYWDVTKYHAGFPMKKRSRKRAHDELFGRYGMLRTRISLLTPCVRARCTAS